MTKILKLGKRVVCLTMVMLLMIACLPLSAFAATPNIVIVNSSVNGSGKGSNVIITKDEPEEAKAQADDDAVDYAPVDEAATEATGDVAKINGVGYATLAEALTAANAMAGDVVVEIYDKVTLNSALFGSYTSIKFVGKSATAEIYLDVQGYITATGKKVAFEDLKLSKSEGGYIANAGFMNLAFGVYDVAEVTYKNCTFANGAYASSGTVTFTGCTFYRSHDRYGMWAYGAQDIVVDKCTFADIRGIKMYDEGKVGTTSITVKETNFSAVTDKPAIVLTYGNRVTLVGNNYNTEKGVFELDLDGAPNGTTVTSDVPPTCINDNGPCGVLVDGKIYTTVAQAAEVATSGSTVTLLHNSTETVEFAAGVTLDTNGYTAENVTVFVPVAQIGNVQYESLEEAFKAATEGCVIEILADVVINYKWDCRDYATNGSHSQFQESVTINGNGHTLKFTGIVSDNNWNTIFRFEENATVKNLTIDISAATGAQRVITAKKSLTVDGLTIIGSAKYGIIFGEGASVDDLAVAEIVITNSTLTGTRRAISDNEGGKDVKSVSITGNTLYANVYVSASESIVFNNNTAAGEVDLRSCAAENVLSVEAKGNTLTAGVKNYIYAKNIDAQENFAAKRPAFKVSTKADLNAALAAAQDGDTIILTADIDYGTDQLAITKAITLDLGGKTLTTRNAYGGMSVKNNPTIKNGTIVHASNTAAIKVWNAVAFEDLVIDVQGKGDANKTIGGIVLQSGSTTRVGSIKNVTIKGAALTNGIETYNCGDADENVIGSMENVTIDAKGTGMLISAPCGTATNCKISGGVNAIEIWIKGNYSASLDLVDSNVTGGVYAHDEFNSNPGVVNNGTLSFTADEDTTGADDVTVTIARANTENIEGVIKKVIDNAQAKVENTYYATLAEAIAAVGAGDVVIELLADATLDYNARDAYGTAATTSLKINGNGHTLTLNQKNSDWASIGLANANAKLVLNNMTIEKTGYGDTSGAWNTHAIIFSCNVEMNNVTVNNSVAVQNGATLNNVTINEAGGYYGLWINGNGQTVTADKLTINATNGGRGIKIADQYIDSPEKVTLTVTNSIFNTAKKAAVLVSSKAGAAITANNVNITNVTEDSRNIAWVDEDCGAYNANVTVTGATKAQEALDSFVAMINGNYYKTLQAAIDAVKNGETIVLLGDIAENVTLTEKTGLYYTIDGAGKKMNGTITIKALSDTNDNRRITIKNINFVDESDANVDFISSVETNHYPRITVDGCTFTGSGNDGDVAIRLKSSHSVVITNCEGTGLHSFLQNTSGWNLTIEKVTVTSSKSGLALGTVQGVTVKGCNVDVNGYGIRMDAQYNNNAVIESNTVKAFIPVVVRKAAVQTNITFQGTNIMRATNTDDLWCAVGTSEYEKNDELPTAAGVRAVITLDNSELEKSGIHNPIVSLVGSGTAAEPFLIGNVEELLWFQAKVDEQAADGSTQFAGKYFKLTADIDLAGINWNPIGSKTGDHASFKGVFDGDGHTIYNLYIEQAGEGLGLFAYTSGNAVIKNLNLVNVTVKSTNNSSYVGGLIGNAYASTKIENVHISGNVYISGRGYIGGIAGHGYVEMDNVSVKANEGGLITSTFWCAGGILGYGGEGITKITNARVEGLTVTSAAGGLGAIVGMAEDNRGTQPISGSNLSAKNVVIKTYVGGYGTAYEDYGIGYLYGGSDISKLDGTLSVENVTVTTASGNPATVVDVDATIGNTIYFNLQDAIDAAKNGETIKLFNNIKLANGVIVPAGKTITLDLNGKTITGIDSNTSGNFYLIDNRGTLTITDSSEAKDGKITLKANNDRNTSSSSVVVANNPGGKLVIKNGTIEHLGGTYMAYAIDNLTNGTGTYAETVIDGGIIKSTYRAVRQFLNGIKAQNILTINGGTITGTNKSIFFHDPSKKANTGTLNVGENAVINGDIYLFVTEGSTEWPVAVSIASSALKEATMTSKNVPTGYEIKQINGVYGVYVPVSTPNDLLAAIEKASSGNVIILDAPVNLAGKTLVLNKGITLDLNGYTLTVDYLVAFKGNNIVDNTRGNGLLVVGKDNLSLSKGNTNMAVWTETTAGNGYKFAQVKMRIQSHLTEYDAVNKGFKIFFRPSVGTELNTILKKDTAINNSGLQYIVRVSWENEKGDMRYQDFVYSVGFIENLYTIDKYCLDLKVTGLSHTDKHKNVKATVIIKSETGVEASEIACVYQDLLT